MVFGWTTALVKLLDVFLFITTGTYSSLHFIRLECFVKLSFFRTGHALATDIKITIIPACEEIVLLLVDLTVADIAVKCACIQSQGATLHPTILWIEEFSFTKRVIKRAADLGLLNLSDAVET